MANEIPGLGSSALKSHLQRRAQKTLEVAQYDQLVTILRYNQTAAGNLAVGIAPTVATCTPALTDLPCSVSELLEEAAEDFPPGLTAIWHGALQFAFRDIPATTAPAVAANTLLLTDFLSFQGDKYRIHHVGNDRGNSDISWCIASLWVRG